MPNRILREGINSSERVNRLAWETEVFYRRLMSVVDDYGRYSAHPALLRASLYPLKLETVREAKMERFLAECEEARLLRLYEVDGKQYLELLDFRQQVRAKESKYPDPPDAKQVRSKCVASAKRVRTQAESETKARIPAANRDLGRSARVSAPVAALAAADLRSEMLGLGISETKVNALVPDLAARGVAAVHVHMLADELRQKRNIDDLAAVAVSRLTNGFQPRMFLSIPEVAMLAKERPVLSIAGTPVNGVQLRVNSGSHRPGVFWDGPNGEKYEARPDDLRADGIVLARTGDADAKVPHDRGVRSPGPRAREAAAGT